MSEDLVEVVRLALLPYLADGSDEENAARAAISAINASGIAKVAPVVATAKMCGEAFSLGPAVNHGEFAEVWSAMISAVEG